MDAARLQNIGDAVSAAPRARVMEGEAPIPALLTDGA